MLLRRYVVHGPFWPVPFRRERGGVAMGRPSGTADWRNLRRGLADLPLGRKPRGRSLSDRMATHSGHRCRDADRAGGPRAYLDSLLARRGRGDATDPVCRPSGKGATSAIRTPRLLDDDLDLAALSSMPANRRMPCTAERGGKDDALNRWFDAIGIDHAARTRLRRSYPSAGTLFAADLAALNEMVDAPVAAAIAQTGAMLVAISEERVERSGGFGSSPETFRYLALRSGFQPYEELRVLYLDSGRRLIADEVAFRGDIDRCEFHTRPVVARALQLGASAIIVAHNHPAGNPTPSKADIEVTRQLCRACKVFDIAVSDHVVASAGDYCSFRALGLL